MLFSGGSETQFCNLCAFGQCRCRHRMASDAGSLGQNAPFLSCACHKDCPTALQLYTSVAQPRNIVCT
eukprot:1839718-Amphidinium_carterae.2